MYSYKLMTPVEVTRLNSIADRLYKYCPNLKTDVRVPIMGCFKYRENPTHRIEEYLDNVFVAPNGVLSMAEPGQSLEEIKANMAVGTEDFPLVRYYKSKTFMKNSGGVNVSSKQVRLYALKELREDVRIPNTLYYKLCALMRLQYGREGTIAPDCLAEYVECNSNEEFAEIVASIVADKVSLTKTEKTLLDIIKRPNVGEYEVLQAKWNVDLYADPDEEVSKARNKMQICMKRFIEKVRECNLITDDTYYAFLAMTCFDFYRRGTFVPEKLDKKQLAFLG